MVLKIRSGGISKNSIELSCHEQFNYGFDCGFDAIRKKSLSHNRNKSLILRGKIVSILLSSHPS